MNTNLDINLDSYEMQIRMFSIGLHRDIPFRYPAAWEGGRTETGYSMRLSISAMSVVGALHALPVQT
jgi:hypothetical protein